MNAQTRVNVVITEATVVEAALVTVHATNAVKPDIWHVIAPLQKTDEVDLATVIAIVVPVQ